MIPERDMLSILANLSPHVPKDVDAALFDAPTPGSILAPTACNAPPSTAIWRAREADMSYIGLRVKAPIAHEAQLAARLAAIALERRIAPIFLSYIGRSGMQRFGFRVEQLAGLTPEAQQEFETQLVRFWGLALVIDASQVAHLG